MTDFAQEIKRLKKLSCISLSPAEEIKFGTQLTEIIAFLGKLPESKEIQGSKEKKDTMYLRTISGVVHEIEEEKIMKNVQHPIINNSIVIKSALS